MDLILASGSPRRRELLEQLGLRFRVVTPAVDETLAADEAPEAAGLRLARAKAEAVAGNLERGLVLAADTLVVVGGRTLGKPADLDEMEAHLRLLSGRTHRVLTALHLLDVRSGTAATAVEATEVEFHELGASELRWYLDSGDGWDKAGSYGYQGMASVLIRRIEGCYFNVVGLPMARLRLLAAELGHDLLAHAGRRGGSE
jgi:septum formation protein